MRAGLRDELISHALRAEFHGVEDRVQSGDLDPAEAAGRLSRYLARVAERELASLPEKDRVERQVGLVNELIAELDPARQLVTPG